MIFLLIEYTMHAEITPSSGEMRIAKYLILLLVMASVMGCATFKGRLPIEDGIPPNMPHRNVEDSPYYPLLVKRYGTGEEYERIKILYLLQETRESPFEFNRNGYVYSARRTAAHISKKYRQRYKKILTAQDFIDKVASRSSQSGRPYLAMPGNGTAYHTGSLLQHELNRLDAFMEQKYGNTDINSPAETEQPTA